MTGTTQPIDAQRLTLILSDLRLPGIKQAWPEMAGRSDKEGWPAARFGTVRISVCERAVEHYAAMALMKRSPKMTANWALAMDHSRGGIFHSFSERFKIR